MDVLLKNGDLVLKSNGIPVKINNFDELVQRCVLSATIKKGSYIYNKQLGNEAYMVDIGDDRALKKIEMLLNESIINVPDVKFTVNEIEKNEENKMVVRCSLYSRQQSKEIMVVI